jgi:hypothetical protein
MEIPEEPEVCPRSFTQGKVLYMGKAETWHFPASADKRYLQEILSRIEKHLFADSTPAIPNQTT